MDYTGLVIATGLRPRRLSDDALTDDPLPDVRHAIWTVSDVARLRPHLSQGARVVIVGAGFLGCELALSAAARGCHVTVVETRVAPMSDAVGVYVGNAIRRHHAHHGVHIATGVDVIGIVPGTIAPAIVSLSDDTELPADVIVECLGSRANVEWLEGNGLDLSDGVLCRHDLSVVGTSNAVAVGEVARFPNSRFGGSAVRVENWRAPNETAGYAASTLIAELCGFRRPRPVFAPLPRCRSRQGDLRLDVHGMPGLGDRKKIVRGELTGGPIAEPVVVEYFLGSDPVGVVALNTPPAAQAAYRNALAAATGGAGSGRCTSPPEGQPKHTGVH
jgi:NADPH-dependent 2,4-dienoyl-CoA reductase/sulfur reductase-like enzyme